MKASIDVRHIIIPCSKSARSQLIPDIIRCYSRSVISNVQCLLLSTTFRHSLYCHWLILLISPLGMVDSVEGALLFSLRQRILLLNLLTYYLEHVLCMGTFSKLSVRYVRKIMRWLHSCALNMKTLRSSFLWPTLFQSPFHCKQISKDQIINPMGTLSWGFSATICGKIKKSVGWLIRQHTGCIVPWGMWY